jgi:hypothetical protein
MSTFTATPFFRLVARVYNGCIAPLQTAARKRSRMRLLGIRDLCALPRAGIDLEVSRADCGPTCIQIIHLHYSYLIKHLFHAEAPAAAARWRSIPLLLALDEYPDFSAYAERIRQASDGNITREINRARARGYYCEPFDRKSHTEDLYQIDSSKLFRSSGLVLPAVMPRPRARHRGSPPMVCPHHWYLDWGVFLAGGEAGEDHMGLGKRLVGYMYVKRVGTTARVIGFMGHGAHLRHGIMKLLFCDVVRRLLDRSDPCVAGIRYLQYGDAEHGGAGLLAWRRRLQFEPFVFSWEGAAPPVDQVRSGA